MERYVSESSLKVQNSNFYNNVFALTSGIAIYLTESICEIYNSTFENSIINHENKYNQLKMTILDVAMSGTIEVDDSRLVSPSFSLVSRISFIDVVGFQLHFLCKSSIELWWCVFNQRIRVGNPFQFFLQQQRLVYHFLNNPLIISLTFRRWWLYWGISRWGSILLW